MKKEQLYVIIICLLSLFVSVGCGPSAEKILGRAYDKCQSIENGYYETTKQIKQIASIDTIVVEQTGHFKKLEDDNIYTFAFHTHFQMPSLDSHMSLLYTGDDMAEYSTNNRPRITLKKGRELEILNTFVKNPIFSSYWPITNKNSYPLPSRELLASGTTAVKLIGEESINGQECYRIRVGFDPSYDNTTVKSLVSRLEYDFWIDKTDYLPLQFTVSRDLTLDAEVVNMYERQTLNKYEFNSVEDEAIFTLASLPAAGFRPPPPSMEPPIEPLPIGSVAPDWEMLSATGKKHSLHDFRGNFVLLEFSIIACPPCIQIIPQLTALQEQYKDKGLQVVAVYSHVRTNADILNYIKKYNIDYLTLLNPGGVSSQYNVTGYPTTYLIDREGKIVFQHVSVFSEKELEQIEKTLTQKP